MTNMAQRCSLHMQASAVLRLVLPSWSPQPLHPTAIVHGSRCAGLPWMNIGQVRVRVVLMSHLLVWVQQPLLQARDRPATLATGLFDDLDAPTNIKQLGASWPYECIARALQTPFTDRWGRVRPLKVSVPMVWLVCILCPALPPSAVLYRCDF